MGARQRAAARLSAGLLVACAIAAGCRSARSPAPPADPKADLRGHAVARADGAGRWKLVAAEDFSTVALGSPEWSSDPVPDDGPYADDGAYFRAQGIHPPRAWRVTRPLGSESFGAAPWLVLEAYTRDVRRPVDALARVVPDPAGGPNRVLRLASPEHTDAVVVRSARPLPETYRVSVRMGWPTFGDGRPGRNGYDGGETGEPWQPTYDATEQNGFYWLAILDAVPRPHNNVWIHHHRKVVIDSDNHYPPWMEVFDGARFVSSGEHPVMVFALDGRQPDRERIGPPFVAWADGRWQPSGAVRAVDAYLPGRWYDASIARVGSRFTLEVSGTFRHGGSRTYRATIDARDACVWHFARSVADDAAACSGTPWWPAGGAWPDWFFFGDPHANYYEGEVFFDDVRLEVWVP